jgi:hypothetical protein
VSGGADDVSPTTINVGGENPSSGVMRGCPETIKLISADSYWARTELAAHEQHDRGYVWRFDGVGVRFSWWPCVGVFAEWHPEAPYYDGGWWGGVRVNVALLFVRVLVRLRAENAPQGDLGSLLPGDDDALERRRQRGWT